ncbi:hypothetical protein IGS59_00870 [Janthinobacterium sp. GW460P]|uniref:hypothetical protein n=1 Tax=unclassified Janthinobacterium TaxID=2610881 RepID=UPI00111C3BC1|nr:MULTISPECIES: hypothetical protein [unclassified Janthinobacterium]MCC7700773.1 hypothetical protein [Janthinobacterium sp. GW460P]MCC7706280.1 hypothetical protein [Janthinobacterium sp. GW460W]
MAYHLMIFKQSTAIEPTISLYLGSAQTVYLYWEAASFDIGLPTISTITERADSEAGFCLSGATLTAFKVELELLYKHWNTSHKGHELPPTHCQLMRAVILALDDESFDNATLMIA